jgi:hypothetical protein
MVAFLSFHARGNFALGFNKVLKLSADVKLSAGEDLNYVAK